MDVLERVVPLEDPYDILWACQFSASTDYAFTYDFLNPLTPKITDFLTHFWPLLPKRKRDYIMTKLCILAIFGSPLLIYEVKITLPCTEKPIWRILFKKVPKI